MLELYGSSLTLPKVVAGGGSQLIQQVGPILHQRHTVIPISRPVVGPTDRVWVLVRQRRLDHIRVVAARIENRARRHTKAVGRHFLTRVAHPSYGSVEGVFGKELLFGLNRREDELRLVRIRPDV